MTTDWRSGLGPALVAALGVVLVVHAELRPPASVAGDAGEGPRATPGVVALLGGLVPGERVAGWEVVSIEGPKGESVRIVFGHGGQRFSIVVVRLGTLAQQAPVQTDRYAIYYGHAEPPDRPVPDGAVRAITHAIARRLRATEHELPVPAGL